MIHSKQKGRRQNKSFPPRVRNRNLMLSYHMIIPDHTIRPDFLYPNAAECTRKNRTADFRVLCQKQQKKKTPPKQQLLQVPIRLINKKMGDRCPDKKNLRPNLGGSRRKILLDKGLCLTATCRIPKKHGFQTNKETSPL